MIVKIKNTAQIDRIISYFKWRIFDKIPGNYWIAGGAIQSYITSGKINSDIDLYFKNEQDIESVFSYLIDTLQFNKIFESDNVIKLKKNKTNIDLVKIIYAGPKETIESFDFTVACAAIDESENFYCHETFFIDLAGRKLVINSLPYPTSTLRRLQKYIKKGFTACNGTLLQLNNAIVESGPMIEFDGLYVD